MQIESLWAHRKNIMKNVAQRDDLCESDCNHEMKTKTESYHETEPNSVFVVQALQGDNKLRNIRKTSAINKAWVSNWLWIEEGWIM